MVQTRRARFERSNSVPRIQFTKRDIDILAQLDRHRLIHSRDIARLVRGSSQQVLRRLQLLFHHGYVDRPRSQIEYFHNGGSSPLVYALSPRGIGVLRDHRPTVVGSRRRKRRAVSQLFLRHAVQKSEIMVALEIACRRNSNVQFVSSTDLHPASAKHSPFEWRVKINNTTELGVTPDDVFALDYVRADSKKERVLFFVESDRSTMPVERRDFSKSSFLRKLIAYESTWLKKIHQTRFACNRFRVLTITTSLQRVEHLVKACSRLKHARGLFLFIDATTLKTHDFLLASWQSARGEEFRLIDA